MKPGVFLILSLIPLASYGQYFGRNKVQYESFPFKIMKTEQFDIHYYPAESTAVADAGRMLERWHTRLIAIFGRSLQRNQPILLYANHADFQQTNAIGDLIPQGTGGVTEGFMNRIIIPLTGINSENDHVLGHELTHAFHYTLMRESEAGITGSQQIPLWFIEGMSEYLSLGSCSPQTAMWMRDAVLSDDVPSFAQVARYSRYFPYRYGHAIWSFIAGTYGDHVITPLFQGVLRYGWYIGFKNVLGISVDSLSKLWQEEIHSAFKPALVNRTEPHKVGTRIIQKGDINLSPIISPDGNFFAFFSTRNLFSIDLFLADSRTGKVLKKLVSSETDEHFEALRFINASGSWSPDGKQFAFIVFRGGNNAISILDIESKKIQHTFSTKEIDEITHLAWSPDGKSILISGTSGAICNLYLYSISDQRIQKITNNAFAKIHPSWAPDGNSIVYATDDRPDSDFDSLKFAPMALHLHRLTTGEKSEICIAPWAKHTSPHFSPDGNEIFFISNPDGYNDLYRYSLTDGNFYRVTRIATGISGLAELSPAMSVASQTGTIVFSVFDKTSYKIQKLEPEQARGTPFTPSEADYRASANLPPRNRENPIVDRYLGLPEEGLVSSSGFTHTNYNPRLRLLYIGQLAVGFSASPLGIGFGGGISFLFSDILGDHLLGLGAQINGSVRDFGAEGFYLNMDKRINWGLALSRIPYVSTRTEILEDTATVDGEVKNVDRVRFIDQRLYDNDISFIAEYPISTNRRFEFSGTYSRISYDYKAEEFVVSDGMIVDRNSRFQDEPSSLNLFRSAVAFVGDFSYFGFTSPVAGRRFRLELEPTAGSLFFLTANLDYRQYFLFNPLTIAFRFFHYGRYLRDAEDSRLSQLFLGYDTWVRGYNSSTFNLAACSESEGYEGCPEFQRLLGSRIGVFNAELRLPIFGTEEFGLINFPSLPTDLVAFLDGGVAWTKDDTPTPELVSRSKDRVPVFSAGGAARFNLFGIFVLQFYYAYPFQRTDKKWHWGFLFAPGW